MGERRQERSWRPARVSSMPSVKGVARRFCPPYIVAREAPWALRVKLTDPSGRLPDISVGHRHERRLFLKANYLWLSSTVPGHGPEGDGELRFRFRGSLSHQRTRFGWAAPVPGGPEWLAGAQGPLLEAVRGIEAVQSLRMRWSAAEAVWRVRLETLSGSMMSGFMTPLPVAVPFDQREADSFIALVDVLADRG
jgi:hypothetical protein